ncbi:hypothetical protein [Streptomyces sp. E5N91]|uniref:hypothetical protein n=1 Tax=Streptomyces sp. E5N91 TaxID=1851996 RepID=UPI000EF564E4|nr:hypothetical protein [Streptomyces sp. E5N91]
MFIAKPKLRLAAAAAVMSAAFVGLVPGTATAADWPPLQEGAYLYSGPNGSGTVTVVDLHDVGTCHTLAEPAVSVQVASGFGAVELFEGPGCGDATSWATSSLTRQNLPWEMLSYRAIPAA